MPIVPSNVLPMRRSQAEGFEQAKPSQTDIAIAAANMDSMGRLFEHLPESPNVEDRRGESSTRTGSQFEADTDFANKAGKLYDDEIERQGRLNKLKYKKGGIAADAGYNDIGKRK